MKPGADLEAEISAFIRWLGNLPSRSTTATDRDIQQRFGLRDVDQALRLVRIVEQRKLVEVERGSLSRRISATGLIRSALPPVTRAMMDAARAAVPLPPREKAPPRPDGLVRRSDPELQPFQREWLARSNVPFVPLQRAETAVAAPVQSPPPSPATPPPAPAPIVLEEEMPMPDATPTPVMIGRSPKPTMYPTSIRILDEDRGRLRAIAKARGIPLSDLMREIIEAYLADTPPPGKVKLSAEVIRAANASGIEFWTFVQGLIALGMFEYRRKQRRGETA